MIVEIGPRRVPPACAGGAARRARLAPELLSEPLAALYPNRSDMAGRCGGVMGGLGGGRRGSMAGPGV
ncbi:MAG: hypothetical protein V4754_00325 [Pseudomonadota bacterium]